ncbi:MAG: PAS domain S-box protein, partial [Elusimicrobia bacterium]|nr:PAS domain S-box protein [Elusimicrobiota bacterium]
GAGAVDAIIQAAADQPIERTIADLVRHVSREPSEQARLMEAVMRRVRDDLDRKVAEATNELRRAKQTLENEATRTQGVLESIAEGVVVVDDQGKVLMMNPEAESLFGTRLAQLAGKPVAEGAREEHLLSIAKELTAPADRPVEKGAEVTANDDTRRTLRASTVVIQNEAGKPVGMVSAISDKAKQREFDRMEREFVAHVTHELRAPLTSIRAALEIVEGMLSGKLDDEAGRMFNNALRNTDRLETLISSILDFSKIESGQMTVIPERSVAGKIAAEASESMRPWATKKGVRLELADRSQSAEVLADVPRTVQVFVNLLSNAIKFTPAGGSITVTVEPDPSTPGMILCRVRDTGPGIPKDQQERVFEKFVQIAAGERHVGGTGLGLAIAKALIHLQQGRMWLESEPGRGAEFLFTIPVFKPPLEEARRATPAPRRKPWWKRLFGV